MCRRGGEGEDNRSTSLSVATSALDPGPPFNSGKITMFLKEFHYKTTMGEQAKTRKEKTQA